MFFHRLRRCHPFSPTIIHIRLSFRLVHASVDEVEQEVAGDSKVGQGYQYVEPPITPFSLSFRPAVDYTSTRNKLRPSASKIMESKEA